ncbi:MAG TPA: amino acid racemase [Candidatus Ozemobacteraceae bacterium]|nr:amino acid racemase [Candidatus Ozemobacteraceae bacterium]
MSQDILLPGIIGGAGPIATTQLYLGIVSRCRLAGVPHRPPLLIASLHIDLAMEQRLLETGDGVEGYLGPLLEAGRALERGGADFLALPCNTLSQLLPALEAAVGIPVMSIVDAVAEEAARAGCRRAGLLATGATIHAGLFQAALDARGIGIVCLDDDRLAGLAGLIREEVEQGGSPGGERLGKDIVEYFTSHGADALVACCTELKSLMACWPQGLPVIDSLDALGTAVVRKMLGTASPAA